MRRCRSPATRLEQKASRSQDYRRLLAAVSRLDGSKKTEIVEKINAANPDVLWVALGLPKQERWIAGHLDRLKAPVIVAIGAAIKFHSGRVVPSPAWASKGVWNGSWRLRMNRKPSGGGR